MRTLLLAVALLQSSPREVFNQAVEDFAAGRVKASADNFDRLVAMAPSAEPQLWQRGIAQYYAGRFKDCRKQFELHRTVNPDDVENAAWHYLCVARAESPAAARKALLPVGPDSRVPMSQVYELFAGRAKPEDVLRAAGGSTSGEFYAHLYLGLYYEAQGQPEKAKSEIAQASDAKYAEPGGYMHTVALVHRKLGNR